MLSAAAFALTSVGSHFEDKREGGEAEGRWQDYVQRNSHRCQRALSHYLSCSVRLFICYYYQRTLDPVDYPHDLSADKREIQLFDPPFEASSFDAMQNLQYPWQSVATLTQK